MSYTVGMKCLRRVPRYCGSAGFFRISAVILLMLLCSSLSMAAEETPSTPSFTGGVDVNIVNIDVFVRDRDGNPVSDLKAEDFLLSRDGVRQEITNFAVITEDLIQTQLEARARALPGREKAGETTPASTIKLRPIWVVVYIDNENLDPIDRTRVLRRIREFVTESLHPPMQMMVVSNQAGLKVLQDFTNDPRQVNAALRATTSFSGGWLERRNTRLEIIQDMRDSKNQGYGRSNDKDTAGGRRQGVYQQILVAAREEANDLDFSLMALRQIVDTLSGLDGRKAILYVSNGLPMTPGLGLMHEYASLYHDNSILSNRARFDRQAQFQALTARATSQDINFYTVDAAGLDVGLGGGAESSYGADPTASRVGESNYQGPMRYMAQRTGGIAVVNTNDVSEGLQRIRNDFFAYYSLGFEARLESNDSVHRIEVSIPGRKNLDIRYRRRFIARSLESRIQDRVSSALLLDIDDNTMGLILTHGETAPAAGERFTVPVRLEVPLEHIAMIPTGEERVGRIELFVGARNLDGRQSDLQRQHHEIRVGPGQDAPERWKYDASLLMGKGSQKVVIAVLDEMTHKVSYPTGYDRRLRCLASISLPIARPPEVRAKLKHLLIFFILLWTSGVPALDFGSSFPGPEAVLIPGRIQAEDFNRGGQFRAYYAETAGNSGNSRYREKEFVDVDIFEDGRPLFRYVRSSTTDHEVHEWLNYTFRTASSGWYEIMYRSRSTVYSTRINTLLDDRFVGRSNRIEAGFPFSDVVGVSAVFLTQATHELKVDLRQTGICIDYISFRKIETPEPLPRPTAFSTPSEIVVADFDVTQFPFHADPSGVSDAAGAIQAALDQLGRFGGGTVFLPAGRYRLQSRGLDVPAGVALVGSWRKPSPGVVERGTVIEVYRFENSSEDHPAIRLAGENACVRNLSIYYPGQYPDRARESTFVTYPFSIATGSNGWGHTIRNITLYNSYRGIRISAGSAHTIADIYGTVLEQGIVTGKGYEFSWISTVDFRNSYWRDFAAVGGRGVRRLNHDAVNVLNDYTNNRLTGIQLGKNDGLLVYGISVRDAKMPVLVKRLPEDDPVKYPRLRAFWGVLSKVKGEIFEVDPYVFPNVHFLNTDLVTGTESMEYSFRRMPGIGVSGDVRLFDVKSSPFGAAGDGITDDTAAIRQALDAASEAGGGIVYLPAGQYRVSGHLSVPSNVELRGPHGAVRRSPRLETCVLLAFEGRNSPRAREDTAFITLHPDSGVRGFSVVYPEQSYGRAAVPYPFTIRGKGENVWIVDTDLENAYLGIDLATYRCDHHLVSDFSATVFKEGIEAGGGSRGGQIQRTLISRGHWNGSSRQNAPHIFGSEGYREQIRENAVAYVFGRSQNESTFGITSFQQFLHILVRGNCRNACFWLPAGDESQYRNVRVDDGGTITLIGAFASILQVPWLETGPDFRGIIRVLGSLLVGHDGNAPVSGGGSIEIFSEESLTTGRPVEIERSCGKILPTDGKEKSLPAADCTVRECCLTVDLGQPSEIFRWKLETAGYDRISAYQTGVASLEYSTDKSAFRKVDTYYGGVGYLDRSFTPSRARYVRLKVADPGVDVAAYISSFQVFGKPGWQFWHSREGWSSGSDIGRLSADASHLMLSSGGEAPFILSPDNLGIVASDFRGVRIRMRNPGSATGARLFFITTTDLTWNMQKSVSVSIQPHDHSFREYSFDFSRNSCWTGSIERLRLAPVAFEGRLEIDSIEFSVH